MGVVVYAPIMTLLPSEWSALISRLAAAGEERAAERLRQGLAQVRVYGPAADATPLSLDLPAGVAAAVERIGQA